MRTRGGGEMETPPVEDENRKRKRACTATMGGLRLLSHDENGKFVIE